MESEFQSAPVIVGEISGNHNGSLEQALKIVESCAAAGVDAIKLQTYTADTITLNVEHPNFRISDDHELWGSRTLHDLYSEAFTPWEWHESIFKRCLELHVTPFSTPFDETAVKFLEDLNCPIYKIASLEIVDLPLIRMVARTKKPLIMSTGAANLFEIREAVDIAKDNGCTDLTLLVCTSSYPAKPSDSNLSRMEFLAKEFNVKVGFSDHTLGIGAAVAAAVIGAAVIEKHVTLSRDLGGIDSSFSIEPDELRLMVSTIRDACSSIGVVNSWVLPSENESIKLRPSLYFTEDVFPGDIVSHQNIRSVRPSGGLAPIEIDKIVGKRILKNAKKGDPTNWSYFDL